MWLVACVLLGGSSSGGLLANAALQIASLPILVAVFFRLQLRSLPVGAYWLLSLVGLTAALMLVSLVPLPFALWRHLPGRAPIEAGYAALGIGAPKLPLTLQVEGTVGALLSLCPPLAMFLLTLRAPPQGRFAAVMALCAITILSIVIGVAQQAAGFGSNLYIYDITSRGGAVGFFANRNHLATLCLTTMPFMAAIAVPSRDEDRRSGRPLLMAGLLLVLILGAIVVQSLAGWLLLAPTLLGCWLIYRQRGKRRSGGPAGALAGLALALVLLTALFTMAPPTRLGEIGHEVTPRDRGAIMLTTWHAARSALPTGTGFGSFVQFYHAFENPALTDTRFVNHAHNDYLELLLEAGLAGMLLLFGFLAWWLHASRSAWRQSDSAGRAMRAASVAIAVMLAHSFVDYPLRTSAMAAVMAFAAGLLIVGEPLRPTRRSYSRAGAGAGADDRISLSERSTLNPSRRDHPASRLDL